MKIEGFVWFREIVDKLASKHFVEAFEVEEVLKNKAKFRFVKQGERKGEDVYMALGRSDAGRYLTVLFIYKKNRKALILSARDMADNEKRRHAKK